MTTALSLLPPAQQPFLDGNGAPLAGGQVTIYVVGTDTFATTYSDPAGAVPNANPLTLDADGYPEPSGQIWGSGPYRMVVQDAVGNTIFDNETTVISVSSAMVPVLEAGTTAAAAALLGLGEGVIIPCSATMDGTAITLTRDAGTNPASAALGTFFCFPAPATQTGPFTLSETSDSLPSETLYDSLGNEITQINENQFCLVAWNPNFGSAGAWVLLFAPQGANTIWTFTATGTWVCPDGINTVLCSGSAGGGAGGASEAAHSGGGGGGGGAAVQYESVSVSSGGTYQVAVGTGGATVAGAAGANGTATNFVSSSFSTLVALAPGDGGAFGNTTGPGASVPGGAAGGAGGTAGQAGYFANADSLSFGGTGGGTIFSSGGAAGLGVGQTPPGFGGGGGGGSGANSPGAGAGGNFVIQIP